MMHPTEISGPRNLLAKMVLYRESNLRQLANLADQLIQIIVEVADKTKYDVVDIWTFSILFMCYMCDPYWTSILLFLILIRPNQEYNITFMITKYKFVNGAHASEEWLP